MTLKEQLEIHHPRVESNKPAAQKVKLLWIVLGLRLGLFLEELGVGLWSQSLSLLAAAGHMFSDVLTVGIALVAIWLAQRAAKNPYNANPQQQAETWAALINSLILVAIAALVTWGAVVRFQTSEAVRGLPMLGMAVVAILIKGLVVRLLYEDSREDLNLRGVFLHAITDAVSSVGVILAALAIYYLDWLWADAVTSLLVAVLMSASALSLIWSSLQQLTNH